MVISVSTGLSDRARARLDRTLGILRGGRYSKSAWHLKLPLVVPFHCDHSVVRMKRQRQPDRRSVRKGRLAIPCPLFIAAPPCSDVHGRVAYLEPLKRLTVKGVGSVWGKETLHLPRAQRRRCLEVEIIRYVVHVQLGTEQEVRTVVLCYP